jgi:hypothetical protein
MTQYKLKDSDLTPEQLLFWRAVEAVMHEQRWSIRGLAKAWKRTFPSTTRILKGQWSMAKDYDDFMELLALLDPKPEAREAILKYAMQKRNLIVHGLDTSRADALLKSLEDSRARVDENRKALEKLKLELAIASDSASVTHSDIGGVRKLSGNFAQPNQNNRADIPIFSIRRKPEAGDVPVPKWLDLAAGPGCDLKISEDYYYIPRISAGRGIHMALIRGDSMCDTLKPGDVVVLEELPADRRVLPGIESEDEKNPISYLRSLVPNDSIAVLSINDEGPTIKRVRYSKQDGKDWKVVILADNGSMLEYPRPIDHKDEVTFWAKLIGIGEEAKESEDPVDTLIKNIQGRKRNIEL